MSTEHHFTLEKLLRFFERLGAQARVPGRLLHHGRRQRAVRRLADTTIDLGLKFDPEPAGVFEAIPALKRERQVHVELAAPSDFLPPLPGWRDRSGFIGRFGTLDMHHYDFVSQALARLERGRAKDLVDVGEMLRRGLVAPEELLSQAEAIRPALIRYPAVDEASFLRRVRAFLEGHANV